MGWNAVFVLSLIVIAVLGCYQVGMAKPYARPMQPEKELSKVLKAEDRFKSDYEDAKLAIQKKSWNSTEDQLESTTLETMTKLAETNHLRLADFRTDKHNDVLDLHETPFVVVVEGGFPDVLAFVETLETSTKLDVNLAVNMLQIASSDSGTGKVTATIGLLGFMYKEAN